MRINQTARQPVAAPLRTTGESAIPIQGPAGSFRKKFPDKTLDHLAASDTAAAGTHGDNPPTRRRAILRHAVPVGNLKHA
ncbi:MAG TPA: hypothetical protein VFR20_12495 [Burkholderiaceae bacterium]|nr:hypothetical protein [Burkholderiaceae bacterium]